MPNEVTKSDELDVDAAWEAIHQTPAEKPSAYSAGYSTPQPFTVEHRRKRREIVLEAKVVSEDRKRLR